MDRVLITCERYTDLPAHLSVAKQQKLGLELQEFSDPNVLDGNWQGLLDQYQRSLDGFAETLTLHGSYIDLVSGSPDKKLVALTRERYLHNLEIGRELGVSAIDFHANYLPLVDHPDYLPGWVERQVDFWGLLAEKAGGYNITLLLENMWEPDPGIIRQILDRVKSRHLQACLDVGHAALYSRLPISAWIKTMGEYLVYAHLHNNHGTTDEHLAFGDGVIDFPELLAALRALPHPPMLSLELPTLDAIKASLPYLQLAE